VFQEGVGGGDERAEDPGDGDAGRSQRWDGGMHNRVGDDVVSGPGHIDRGSAE
jgi:hypothetical protein